MPSKSQRFLGWIADYVYAIVHQLRTPFIGDPLRYEQGDGVPIVIIPGVYERWGFMEPLAHILHKRGHPIHFVPELGININDIPSSVEVVRKKITQFGLTEVILVTHSKGGLIGKYLMQDSANIAHMYAIATPFSGSAYARWLISPPLRDLSPRNKLIQELSQNTARNHLITSLYAAFDPHIPAGSYLKGAENICLPAVGHFRVLKDLTLITVLLDNL